MTDTHCKTMICPDCKASYTQGDKHECGQERYYIKEFSASHSLTEKDICIIDRNHTQDHYYDLGICRDMETAELICKALNSPKPDSVSISRECARNSLERAEADIHHSDDDGVLARATKDESELKSALSNKD